MIRMVVLLLLGFGALSAQAEASLATQSASFKAGASSSGWIDIVSGTNIGIYLPVEINGVQTMAFLYGGPSTIDEHFAAKVGLVAKDDASHSINGLQIKLGDAGVRPDQ